MTVVPIDTHAVVKDLIAAGFTDEQAEAVTVHLRRVQDIDRSYLATKVDLAVFVTKADLAHTKAEILKWMISTIGVQTVVIFGGVIALAHLAAH